MKTKRSEPLMNVDDSRLVILPIGKKNRAGEPMCIVLAGGDTPYEILPFDGGEFVPFEGVIGVKADGKGKGKKKVTKKEALRYLTKQLRKGMKAGLKEVGM